MNKLQLKNLVDAYNGKDELFQSYRKGFRKRLFGLRTDGIKNLEGFLKSNEIKSLNDNEHITGENLHVLITLLQERDERIRYTRRGYEAYPSKSTNEVYQRIYELLCLDVVTEETKNNGIFTKDDLDNIKIALITRESHKRQYEYEQKAKQGDYEAAKILGIGLTSDKPVEFLDYQQTVDRTMRSGFSISGIGIAGPTKISWEMEVQNQKFSAVMDLLSQSDLLSCVIIPAALKFKPDFEAGIKWLEYASDKGSKSASYHLAKLYANEKCGNEEIFNKDKAVYYLKITADLGNETVIQLLREGGAFGKIVIPANTYEPKNSLPKNVK